MKTLLNIVIISVLYFMAELIALAVAGVVGSLFDDPYSLYLIIGMSTTATIIIITLWYRNIVSALELTQIQTPSSLDNL